MISFKTGSIFESDEEALVNPVNCVGVMGAGLALEFKRRFKENFSLYRDACQRGNVEVGRMFVTHDPYTGPTTPRLIINFPTKIHWKAPSQLEWIERGLIDLRSCILDYRIKSIAIPALGAGHGNLYWPDVKALISSTLSTLEKIEINVYEPVAPPSKIPRGLFK